MREKQYFCIAKRTFRLTKKHKHMKKIFTFFAVTLVSLAMTAQTLTISTATKDGKWYVEDGVGRVTNKSGNDFSSPDLTCEGSTGYKTGSSYFTIQTYQQISGITVWARSSSNRTLAAVTVSEDLKSSAQSTDNVEYERTGGTEAYPVPKNVCDNEFTLSFSDAVAADSYIQIALSGNADIVAVTFIGGTPSTDPVLNVDKDEVSFALTAAKTLDSAVVKFTGKNLTAGNYALNVPNVAGLTVNPTSVTVGEDGKLNAQVTIAYTSAVDVPAASTAISLTIGELSKSVSINYSASFAIQYIQNSLNIEQLVMDNGKNYDIQAALAANNIEFANLNALDSLNNSKGAGRNEAYLGLKIKTAGGYIAGWLQQGQTARVKFGFVDKPVKVTIGGMELTVPADSLANPVEFTALVDTYVKFTTTSGNTVVIKQIMLNEPIATLMYPITYQAAENGSVSGWKVAFPNETVQLTVTPAEGYLCTSLAWNNNPLHDEVEGQPITFTMPAEPVNVVATFDTDFPTAIENGEAETKVVKFMENGQLMIRKNGVVYNAQGAVVK